MPKITSEEFKNRVQAANPGFYDLSSTSFNTTREHVEVFCIKGQHVFSQRPDKLMKGIGCVKCYGYSGIKETSDNFIKKTNEKYGEGLYKFDKLIYINAHTVVELYCTTHSGYFTIKPNHFLSKNSKGCNICQKNTAYSTEEFIEKCKNIYGDTFSYDSTAYINQRTKVLVFCNMGKHDYEISPKTLLKGKAGCGTCSGKSGRNHEQFIVEAYKVHGIQYDYCNALYESSNTPIKIICKEHGEFKQTPKAHLTGRGCPGCGEYGYQPHKSGTFYIQKLSNEEKTVYKFGISGDVVRRMREQSRKSTFNHELLHEIKFDDGNDALLLEKKIKSTIPYGVVTKEELYSGFSETFEEEYLEEVLKMIKDA